MIFLNCTFINNNNKLLTLKCITCPDHKICNQGHLHHKDTNKNAIKKLNF